MLTRGTFGIGFVVTEYERGQLSLFDLKIVNCLSDRGRFVVSDMFFWQAHRVS